ncbi:MAG: pyruvate kinase [Flavobacteriales bacterium]|nr:pyruvate kinase [Flavobacteriales bacterium]MBL6876743.1 pyruvate kinase [Flavobacteriales bacterium]
MKKIKKTKIIATLGPATSSTDVIKKIIKEGVDVLRINFSHSSHEEAEILIKEIRKINSELNTNTSILADLQGPKLRIGEIIEGTSLDVGSELKIKTGKEFVGDDKLIFINYESLPKDITEGEKILIDDGKIILKVIDTNKKDQIKTEVIQGGEISSNKGFNLPNTNISQPALTDKDIKDAIFSAKQNVDWIALSFVRHDSDVKSLIKIIEKNTDHRIPVIAKIEKPEGVKNIDEIMKHASGIMVARGDLGVEIDAAEVPLIQKKLVYKAKKARIPVIIATQMMESMMESMNPNRAEVNDVANSVMDGADAVMLSGETSVGKYPVEVVQTISKIIGKVENSSLISLKHKHPTDYNSERFITKSICYYAAKIANDTNAKAISTLTNSGYTAYQISSWRPKTHVLVFTSNKRILTQLNLLWGVKAFYYDGNESTDKTVEEINDIAFNHNYLQKDDKVINLTSMPIHDKGMVNTVRVSKI